MAKRIYPLAGVLVLAITCNILHATAPASAQSVCKPRETIEQVLSQKYNEQPGPTGVTSSGGILQIYLTADGATWSAVVHLPDGLSCLVSNGENWRDVDQVSLLPEA